MAETNGPNSSLNGRPMRLCSSCCKPCLLLMKIVQRLAQSVAVDAIAADRLSSARDKHPGVDLGPEFKHSQSHAYYLP